MLWAKDLPLDQMIHRFTVGEDPVTDLEILEWDALASAAHARGLVWIGALSAEDGRNLIGQLQTLQGQAQRGELTIRPDQEDAHTLLEEALTNRVGEAGKRIHLGRSRNDQVAVAVRLWMRQALILLHEGLNELSQKVLEFGTTHESIAMPGYTHGRRAMPSSVGQWSAAYLEALIEESQAVQSLDRRFDKCPLGGGAGYGVPLALDRHAVAQWLGFRRVHISPIDVQNSRGRLECALGHELASIGLVLERLASDLWLFTTEEFGFFGLPDEFTTGSSIMPQKRNPDVIELLRGRCRELRGYSSMLDHLAAGLPGGYHRDFQLLKRPLFQATRLTVDILRIFSRLFPELKVCRENLYKAMSPELFATQVAFEKVAAGATFRDAYREVAALVKSGQMAMPTEPVPVHLGAVGEPGLGALRVEAEILALWPAQRRLEQSRLEQDLFDLDSVHLKS
jgi:argininosuccinate lyase